MKGFSKGDHVRFGRTFGEKTLAKVVRVNKSTLTLEQLEKRGTKKDHEVGTKWRVPKELCEKVHQE